VVRVRQARAVVEEEEDPAVEVVDLDLPSVVRVEPAEREAAALQGSS
jgi:hypothetical protein